MPPFLSLATIINARAPCSPARKEAYENVPNASRTHPEEKKHLCRPLLCLTRRSGGVWCFWGILAVLGEKRGAHSRLDSPIHLWSISYNALMADEQESQAENEHQAHTRGPCRPHPTRLINSDNFGIHGLLHCLEVASAELSKYAQRLSARVGRLRQSSSGGVARAGVPMEDRAGSARAVSIEQ